MTDSSGRAPRPQTLHSATKARARFLLLGVIVGVLWYVNGDRPLWEHALRMLVIMLVVLVALELLARRRYRGSERPRIPHGVIITAKLALLALVSGADWLLGQWTSRADLVVAVGLAAVVAIAGPRVVHHAIEKAKTR